MPLRRALDRRLVWRANKPQQATIRAGSCRGVGDGSTRCENRRVTKSKIDVKDLSAEERLNLIEQIWDSLEAEDVPVTECQTAELDRRIEEMDRDGERGIPWEDVLDRIRGRAK